jgi:hypothetical protein
MGCVPVPVRGRLRVDCHAADRIAHAGVGACVRVMIVVLRQQRF